MKNAKRWKKIATLATISIIVLGAVAAALVAANGEAIRSWVEREAAARTGLDLQLAGSVGLRMSPRPTVRLADVSIRRDDGSMISARAVMIEPVLGALFSGRAQVRAVTLDGPEVMIEGSGDAPAGFVIPEAALDALDQLGLERLAISDATLEYRDAASERVMLARGCALTLDDLQATGAPLPSFAIDMACESIETDDIALGTLQAEGRSADGVLSLDPVTLSLFGSQMRGQVQADLNDSQPQIQAQFALDDFALANFFERLEAEVSADGSVDIDVDLTMRGMDAESLARSAAGRVSLRGRDLVLHGVDLDETIARFESSQSFHLVDLGAVFLAGPFGMVATQGYRFGSLAMSPQGKSEVRALVSDWRIENGVATARDVALATDRHRIAARGRIDFADRRFEELTVALLDAEGCASAEQTLDGPFEKAGDSGGGLVGLITGPTRNLFERGAALFSSGECEPFYSGSVAAPR
ncbi:MAG: AsmA family protein [Azoarcus sp.]|nr:AsmA family protein [Azoarcus sp.]